MSRMEKTSPKQKTPPKETTFQDTLSAWMGVVAQAAMRLRTREHSGVRYGEPAAFILALENLNEAREQKDPTSYVHAAVYALAAAMLLHGSWLKPIAKVEPKAKKEPKK